VITTRPEEDYVFVTNSDGGADIRRPRRSDSELWTGFYQIEPKSSHPPKPHPWALIVESIIA
jgi:hypothetical protein